MNYFREYMISVCVILILTSVASEILVDFSWSKYINLVCGVLFAVCLFNPVGELINTGFSIPFEFDESEYTNEDYIFDNVKKEFGIRLSKEISEDINSQFAQKINIKAELTDDKKIIINLQSPIKENIYEYIKQKYKPEKINILGE